MSAFTIASVLGATTLPGDLKFVDITATGPTSYDTAGSVLDVSSAATLLGSALGFTAVHGMSILGVTAAADSKYQFNYVRAASGAPATGKIKLHDSSAAADAEVTAATNLSAVTFVIRVEGK